MKSSTTRTFPGRFDSLAAVADFVTRAAKAAGFDRREVHAVELAVDEAFTNIVEHAYESKDNGDVKCICHVTTGELTVILHDHGRPFDPTCVPKPDLCDDVEKRLCGGLGLHFMHNLMDEVCFEFSPDSGNTLTMVKRKEQSP